VQVKSAGHSGRIGQLAPQRVEWGPKEERGGAKTQRRLRSMIVALEKPSIFKRVPVLHVRF